MKVNLYALPIIKNKYRCVMGESILTDLSILSLECGFTINISFKDVIKKLRGNV